MKIQQKLNQTGDTIIEVLLSIAVLSFVLTISYGLASSSSQTTRASQERSEAQKITEEQLELLRGFASKDNPWQATWLCLIIDGANQAAITEDPAQCARGDANRYNIRITYDPSNNSYTVATGWDNVKGGQDQLNLAYKISATGDLEGTDGTALPDCNNTRDDDGDGLTDIADPGCHSDGNPSNTASYDPTDNSETDPPPPPDTTPYAWAGSNTTDTNATNPPAPGICSRLGIVVFCNDGESVTYNVTGVRSGVATFEIYYRTFGSPSNPAFNHFNINVLAGNASGFTPIANNVVLPISQFASSYGVATVNIPVADTAQIKIEIANDTPGGDILGIYGVKICRPANGLGRCSP